MAARPREEESLLPLPLALDENRLAEGDADDNCDEMESSHDDADDEQALSRTTSDGTEDIE